MGGVDGQRIIWEPRVGVAVAQLGEPGGTRRSLGMGVPFAKTNEDGAGDRRRGEQTPDFAQHPPSLDACWKLGASHLCTPPFYFGGLQTFPVISPLLLGAQNLSVPANPPPIFSIPKDVLSSTEVPGTVSGAGEVSV